MKRGRGNFDIAILSEEQVANASLDQFRQGRIAAGIVVELGLDYQLKHLKQDLRKLQNSEVPAGYLVDLSRNSSEKPDVRDWILEVQNTRSLIGIAYAHHSTRGGPGLSKMLEATGFTSGGGGLALAGSAPTA